MNGLSYQRTATLLFNNVFGADVGSYDCVVSNTCGNVTTSTAALTAYPGGAGDGNASGSTDGVDIQGMVNVLTNGGAPSAAYCAYDMNADAVVDMTDVPLFVALRSSGTTVVSIRRPVMTSWLLTQFRSVRIRAMRADRTFWLDGHSPAPIILTLLILLSASSPTLLADSPCVDWTNVSPIALRTGHAMAYDSTRGVTVLFGGANGGFLNDTWEWNGTIWTQRFPSNVPSSRIGHAMAYDSARGVTVLFGGLGDSGYLSDTWEWDGTLWTQRSPATKSSVRFGHAMAYDSTRGVTVLFGGANGGYLSDTWEWDGTLWTQRSPATKPSVRFGHAMAYDSARGKTVLFGGISSGFDVGDTWEWDGTNWTQRSAAKSPSARYFHAMAYENVHDATVLFGGFSSGTDVGDTWEWDGTNWTQRSPSTSPSVRYGHAMAYDSVRGVTMLLGGGEGGIAYFGETWEWDGTTWTQRSPATSPPARRDDAMAYDSARGVTVLFGGYVNTLAFPWLADTWEWNGTTWAQRSPATSPSARRGHAMAYDSVRGVTVLFGGSGASYFTDTWEWDGANWTLRSPVTSPPMRIGHTMAYDSVRHRTVLYGGYTFNGSGNPVYLGDTWEWDGQNWAQPGSCCALDGTCTISSPENCSGTWTRGATCSPNFCPNPPASVPLERGDHAMAYDSARGVTVLFGGSSYSGVLGDTWEWNGTRWTQRSPATSLLARFRHGMAYDSEHGVTVLFGGYSAYSDTWEWNGTNWTQRRPVTSPSPRSAHKMVFDIARGVTVLFGGEWNGIIYGDTWEFAGVPGLDADINVSGRGDGLDISRFVAALLNASTAPDDLCHADFNANGVIEIDDVPDFTQKLLGL